jgi:hypothetical protein
VTALIFARSGQLHSIVLIISAILSFDPTWLLGFSLFVMLRARHQTHLRFAVIFGFSIGITSWMTFCFLFPLWLEEAPGFDLTDITLNSFILLLAIGGLGSIVGATLWFIARPDRYQHVVVEETR